MSIHLNFEDARIRTQMAEISDKIFEAAWEEISQVMTLMKGFAQVYVPVDTGSLRDSIRIERGGQGKGWRVIGIRAGGYIVNPKTGKLVDYAYFVEQKQSYICRAWHVVCPNIMDLIQRGVLTKVEGT